MRQTGSQKLTERDLEGAEWQDTSPAGRKDGVYCCHSGNRLAALNLKLEEAPAIGALMAASPDLALACLAAVAFTVRVREWNQHTPLGDAAHELLGVLLDALESAGVGVEHDEPRPLYARMPEVPRA